MITSRNALRIGGISAAGLLLSVVMSGCSGQAPPEEAPQCIEGKQLIAVANLNSRQVDLVLEAGLQEQEIPREVTDALTLNGTEHPTALFAMINARDFEVEETQARYTTAALFVARALDIQGTTRGVSQELEQGILSLASGKDSDACNF